jgi:hypothetical protein
MIGLTLTIIMLGYILRGTLLRTAESNINPIRIERGK